MPVRLRTLAALPDICWRPRWPPCLLGSSPLPTLAARAGLCRLPGLLLAPNLQAPQSPACPPASPPAAGVVDPPEPEERPILGLTFSDAYYYLNIAYWWVCTAVTTCRAC